MPAALRLAGGLDLAPGLSEPDVLAEMERLADANRCGPDLVCFAGGGAYDHEVPAAVRRLAFRSEFVTAYTPYQPEVAQGVLQALFEYQTMVCRLTGMEVANASLYDGATACVEAVNLAVAATGRPTCGSARASTPTGAMSCARSRRAPATTSSTSRLTDGVTDWSASSTASRAPSWCSTPTTWAASRTSPPPAAPPTAPAPCCWSPSTRWPPGCCGRPARTAPTWWWGRGSPSAPRSASAGPTSACSPAGSSTCAACPAAWWARPSTPRGAGPTSRRCAPAEQDIRREKASSNVCTNQTLIAVCCAIQLSWLGTTGLRELALRCARATRYTRDALLAIDGVTPVADAPVLREFAVRTPVPADVLVDRMAEEGFLAGVALGDEYGGGLLVAVTERRTRAEIDAYAAAFEKVLT